MDRRDFLVGAGASVLPATAAALPVPASGEIGFKVLRNGSPIGEQHLYFSGSGGDIVVTGNAAFRVAIAGIPVFTYTAQATERWQDGVFQSLDSQVNDNGNQLQVQARRTAGGYHVRGTHVPLYLAPPDMLPLTYWNKQMMYGTILNIQTAHSYRVHVAQGGWNRLPTAEGGSLVAQRFDLSGKLHLSIWYDQFQNWSGLEFHVSGDETYQKITA